MGADPTSQEPRAPTGGTELQIRQLGAVLSLGFVIAILGLGYWSLVRAQALVSRTDNPRLIEAERRIQRGDILDRRGRPVVVSQPGDKGTWNRSYLVPEMAPVVGYSSIDYGTSGIERAYDAQIRGEQPTTAIQKLWADLLHLHSSGVSVTLTIDADVQRLASQALGDRVGAVVVLGVPDGEVIAMASQPTFDPNTLEADLPRLQSDLRKPMLNRAVQGLYPPGLIFETITLAAAMQQGLAGPSTVFTDDLGVILTVDPPISCPSNPPATRFTLAEAYTWPCSVLFARLGLDLGGERLADYATQFGVGRPTGLPIDAATGQLLARGVWSNLIAARTAMGQGEVLVTPLEMGMVAATIANDGVRPVPALVLTVDGQTPSPPAAPRQVLDKQIAQQLRTILAESFAVGQRSAALPAADLAGRAGSADSGMPGAPPHAWFIGFAPVAQPRYAIAVIVEHGNQGWEVAAPIAIQVLAALKD